MKFGYELEFFVVDRKGNIAVPPETLGRFHADGHVLVEARGEALSHPKLAEASLKLKIEELRKAVRKEGLKLLLQNEAEITPQAIRKALCKEQYVGII
jgi:hypothetical protein